MCGIAGVLNISLSIDMWEDCLRRMANAIAHRGPDDEGTWFDVQAGVGLAHRRLSIIDLSSEGHQPMMSFSGRYVIVYNGEVYNFGELRSSLEGNGIKWRGRSDTEVILAAIETWGIDGAVQRFIGMFAFALWDRKEQDLYLCRDRLGIKPIYYSRNGRTVLFGSELKAIKAHAGFVSEINRDAITLFLRHNYIPAPYSIYKNTWKLKPGHILKIPIEVVNNGQELPESYPYWSAKTIAETGQKNVFDCSEFEAVEQLEDLLRDAVKIRMISDVPLGVFLSGGIDSSVVTALMQAQSSQPVKTFSIGFHEAEYNEAQYAKSIAEYLGTEHTELYLTSDDALKVIPYLPQLWDEPFSDSSQIPTFLLSKMTRDHVSVSLSGDGGDELFGGYDRYFLGQSLWRKIGWMPVFCKKGIASVLFSISPDNWDRALKPLLVCSQGMVKQKIQVSGDRLHKLAEILCEETFESMYLGLISHWKKPAQVVVNGSEPLTIFKEHGIYPGLSDDMHKMMFLDLVTYLPDDILTKVDRASMGVSLEVRVPILDHRVVEFAWRLPLSMKIQTDRGKKLLRRILYKYVPKELIERPKMGFGIPIDFWLRGPLREWAEELLSKDRLEKDGFFNPLIIRKIWKEHLTGKRNWQYYLWDVLVFQGWLEHENYSGRQN